MNTSRAFWPVWEGLLRRHGATDMAAWVLEAAGPVIILGAQVLYISEPFVSPKSGQSFQALAYLLDHEEETRDFIALLKGEGL